MARSAVDLPDPLENAKVDATGGADDLLSQLAGDEIDRLISESDAAPPSPEHVDRPPVRSAAPLSATDISAKAILNANESAMEALLTESDEAQRAADTIEHTKPSAEDMRSAEELIARQAAELIAQVERENAEMAAAASAPAEPPSAAAALAEEMEADERAHAAAMKRMKEAPADEAAPAQAQTSVEVPDENVESSHAATDTAAEVAQAAPATQIDEAEIDLSPPAQSEEEIATPRVPLIVRFLELLNAPLASVSDAARQAIGKIALVTSVNAIAVLLYVLISRKH